MIVPGPTLHAAGPRISPHTHRYTIMSPVQFILAPALAATLGPFKDNFRHLTLLEVR